VGAGPALELVVQNHALHRDKLGGGGPALELPGSAKSRAPPRQARWGRGPALDSSILSKKRQTRGTRTEKGAHLDNGALGCTRIFGEESKIHVHYFFKFSTSRGEPPFLVPERLAVKAFLSLFFPDR